MCGICGYVGDERIELIEAMCAAMAHRGPDDLGRWQGRDGKVSLGHRRLSIVDLSPAGHQPMSNEDGTIWVTFSGEIYDFARLREDLISKGHQFRSQTDTEVLVHLYEEKGVDMLEDLNGMFAFAIWDTRQRQLFMARDHAGIKPLYYWQTSDRLYFASEIKALLQIPEIPRQLNRDVIPQYLTLLWVAGEQTMLKEIRKLEPGHCLIWKDGKSRKRRWFSLDYSPDESTSEADWIDSVRQTFIDVTRRQMVADVPLGAFLSGGLDSSSIAACMRGAFPDRPITCYTARLDPQDAGQDHFVDDYPYAKKVAEHLRIDLREFMLKPDVTSLLPKMIWHLDEPDADPAVFPSYLIAKAAREDGTTVLLSGTGGDEIFFGYRSHEAYYRYQHMPRIAQGAFAVAGTAAAKMLGAQHPLSRRAAKFGRAMSEEGLARHLALVAWSTPQVQHDLLSEDLVSDVDSAIRPYFDSFQGSGELNRHSHVLIQTFLAAHNFLYTDKSSMATSVEVRVPFMDLELMRLCARIPERYQIKDGVTKHILKQAMSRYLPPEVIHRSKTGFMAPLRKWIIHDLAGMIEETLSPARLQARGLFRPEAVRRIIDENRSNRADHAYLIYALVTLEIWMQTFIDRAGVEQSAN